MVPGGGVALLGAIPMVQKHVATLTDDAKTGAEIILKALESPLLQIAENAGVNGAVVVNQILANSAKNPNYGYDALKGEFGDIVKKGIIDPTKVARSALQNAASVAATLLTTESVVADLPEPEPAMPAGGGMGGMGGMY